MPHAASVGAVFDREASSGKSATTNHLLFFDLVRNVAMLAVILFHAVAAYSTMTPSWNVHDGTSILADLVRQVFDVFMMPVFFFISGYFVLPSLRRRSTRSFVADKLKRLGVPWLLGIMVVVPLAGYKGQLNDSAGGAFLDYWVSYVGRIGTFQMGPLALGQTTQMHFWYISLLLVFAIAFGLLYRFTNQKRGTPTSPLSARLAPTASLLRVLLPFGVLTSAAYFVTALLVPDTSWVTLDLLLQFQPTKAGLYALYFGLGIYACSRQWFAEEAFPGRPAVWALASVLLIAGFLVVGQPVFAHPADSQMLSPVLLLTFALVRSFLCLSLLFALASFAIRYGNRPLPLNQELAAHSYNIYLAHLVIVVVLQNMLMMWTGGPVLAKIGIVALVTIVLSYWISRLICRFPRGFAAGLIGLLVLVAIVTL